MDTGLNSLPRASVARMLRAAQSQNYYSPNLPVLFDPAAYGTCTFWGRSDRQTTIDMTQPSLQQILQIDNLMSGVNALCSATTQATPFWLPDAWRGLPGIVFNSLGMTASVTSGTGTNPRSLLIVLSTPQTPYTGNSSNPRYAMFGDSSTSGTAGQQSALHLMVYSSLYRVAYSGNGSNLLIGGATTATPSSTVPDICCLTYDGTTATLYVNGTSVFSASVTLINTTDQLVIGGAPSGLASRFVWFETATWSTALSATQVTEITSLLQNQWRML